ncbi:MAG: DUF2442 domain-containing protein [Clostridia bacterium]|jgi:hypothetical protein|nr:DUF2442 domain-containing protein [Clostridia bacterium]MCI9413430.1 DUF2442 domain-containing protein [Clostridia bacterium]
MKPVKVKALKDYLLYILFENGEEKIYDMKPNLKYPFYTNLKDIQNFKKVEISGINIEWETGEDVAPENLYHDSQPMNEYKGKIEELD